MAAIAGATVVALALCYLGARETPVFAVRTIEISGGTPAVRQAVRATALPVAGESLVGLDGGALVRRLEALPAVRSVSYDRAFPSTLRILIRPERPVAVVDAGSSRWIVSERGRIIGRAPTGPAELPHFRLFEQTSVEPGAFVTGAPAGVILRALAAVPARFPARIGTVRLRDGALTMALHAPWGEPELRLGEPVDMDVKLAVAALVLRSLPAEQRGSTGYVDVSVPERTVAGRNPQPEG